ncbi:MAG: hypothetical protein RR357_01750 [Clostridia bacterium]
MKYDDIKLINSEVSMNDYVVSDIRPKRSLKTLIPKFSLDKMDMFIYPIVLGTVVSLGFLIAQVAKLVSLSSSVAIIGSIL